MKAFFLLFILIPIASLSQKVYEFDYIFEYELTIYNDSIQLKDKSSKDKIIRRVYLTNSKQNSYLAVITELDSLNYQMDFKDENGLSFNVNFLKSDLNKAEFINVDCKYVRNYSNPYKFRIREYDFINLKDTIIENVEYGRYKLTSNKPKLQKRKKLATEFYIIDKATSFHLPIFYFPTAYEEWKSKKNIPNGIFKQRYMIDFYGNLSSKETLLNSAIIDKKIVIKDECDYTKNP